MSRLRENCLLAATVILCALLFCVKLTGGIWHAVFGISLASLSVCHTLKRFAKRKRKESSIRVTDWVILAALFVMFLSGMLMHPYGDMLPVKLAHKLSSVVFLLSTAGHVCQHKALRRRENRNENRERSSECFIKDC